MTKFDSFYISPEIQLNFFPIQNFINVNFYEKFTKISNLINFPNNKVISSFENKNIRLSSLR